MKPDHLVTRQRLWQRNKTMQGLCCQCAEPAPDGVHCESCRKKCQERSFINNRLRKGIPLDWPKWARWKGPVITPAPNGGSLLDRHLSGMFGL